MRDGGTEADTRAWKGVKRTSKAASSCLPGQSCETCNETAAISVISMSTSPLERKKVGDIVGGPWDLRSRRLGLETGTS